MIENERRLRRWDVFVKLNRVSVLIAKNVNRLNKGIDLTKEDWKEASDLFNECMEQF